MARVSILMFLLVIAGCSAIPFMGGGGPSLGVEATMGDKNQAIVSETQTAKTINNVTELPWYYIVLIALLAGWAIPSPMECFRGLINVIRLAFGKAPMRL